MEALLISTPILFLIYLILLALSTRLFRSAASSAAGGEHELEPYACGQRNVVHTADPTFYRVYPYAFFFTVMHVLVLVIATAPREAHLMPVAYVCAGVLAMVLLFKKRDDVQ